MPPPFPQILGVCVSVCGGGWEGGRAGGCASARRVCECVCVCCTHLISFFTLAFVLVNDLSLVSCCSCFGNAYDLKKKNVWFMLPFVSFCCIHLYFMFTAVSYQIFFH